MSKFLYTAIVILACAAATSCEEKKTAAQLHAEKELAWRADKKQRATKAYQQIVQKYPDSPFAAEARKRLDATGASASPKAGGK